MASLRDERPSRWISTARAISDEAEASFGELTARQLNWKPSDNSWSIAQCLDHLVIANESYFPAFERVLAGETATPLWGRLPWLPAIWGKLLLGAVSPETTRKSKAPKTFHPTSSGIDGAILSRFVDRQNQVIGFMDATQDLDTEKIIISSPVTPLITYSLMDAYRIIVAHEKRHLLQASRVSQLAGFPA